ncbi:hypothetical protein ACWKX9_26700, partial [Enterobacter asburiae]
GWSGQKDSAAYAITAAKHEYIINAYPGNVGWNGSDAVTMKLKVFRDGQPVGKNGEKYKITTTSKDGLVADPSALETDENGEASITIKDGGVSRPIAGTIYKLNASISPAPDDASGDSKLSTEIWLRGGESLPAAPVITPSLSGTNFGNGTAGDLYATPNPVPSESTLPVPNYSVDTNSCDGTTTVIFNSVVWRNGSWGSSFSILSNSSLGCKIYMWWTYNDQPSSKVQLTKNS